VVADPYHFDKKQDPDLHKSKKLDPDPHYRREVRIPEPRGEWRSTCLRIRGGMQQVLPKAKSRVEREKPICSWNKGGRWGYLSLRGEWRGDPRVSG
jgi:hypothetical protein